MQETVEHWKERHKVLRYYKWIFWCVLVPTVIVDYLVTQHTDYASTWVVWLVNYVWTASIVAFASSLLWLIS